MSEFKGTKGKWEVTNNIPNGLPDLDEHIEIASNEWSIACVFNDIDEAQANAKLIACAPEMLEFIKSISENYVTLHEKAQQLIKKATD